MSTNPLNDISKVYLEQVSVASRARNAVADDRLGAEQEKTDASMNRLRQQNKRFARVDASNAARKVESDVKKSSAYGPQRPKPGTVTGRRIEDPKPTGSKPTGYRTESAVPGKPAERLGAVTAIPKSEQEAARERLLAKAKAKREKMKKETEIEEALEKDPFGRPGGKHGGVPKKGGGYDRGYQAMQKKLKELEKTRTEALDPVGQETADIDNDNDVDKSDKYLHKKRKAIGKAIAKRTVKEGFSNWREDLSEVMDAVNKKEKEEKITEKTVKNKIKINPNMGEAVENLGGTLLEMVEIDEMDYIIESVYTELLSEGYDEDDIEEALEYSLTEAKVTFGHDTASAPEKKKSSLLSAAKERLSSLKKSAKATVARGARKVAKGALGVARKMEGGSEAPKRAERKPSTYRGAGAGSKEKVSSGSYTPPTKKKAEKPSDPWEGTATTPPKAKPKKATAPKAKTKTTTAPKRKRKSKLDDLLASVRSESIQIDEMPYQVMGSPDGGKEKKIGKPVKSRKYADARAAELADTHKATGGKYRSQYVEEVQIDEKTLTDMEMKKREEIVKSMKDKASDFEKRYPGRGKEVMYATATKMAKKMVEQMLPNEAPAIDKKKEMMDKQKLANMKMLQQKQEMLRRKELQMKKSGKLPLETP